RLLPAPPRGAQVRLARCAEGADRSGCRGGARVVRAREARRLKLLTTSAPRAPELPLRRHDYAAFIGLSCSPALHIPPVAGWPLAREHEVLEPFTLCGH